MGAKHLAVVSRSGHADVVSQRVVVEVQSLGCQIDLPTADVAISNDVERAFQETTVPIAGIIQGAMVLRVSSDQIFLDMKLISSQDRTFESMSVSDYHRALACKIQGTWNLHNAAEKIHLKLISSPCFLPFQVW